MKNVSQILTCVGVVLLLGGSYIVTNDYWKASGSVMFAVGFLTVLDQIIKENKK